MQGMSPQASIVITTRNRRDELAKAVESALGQKVEGGVETIIIDDGSTDGTSGMIAEKFPQVKLHRFETSRGLIVQRNHGARLAAAPIIFSIDDDACFTTDSIVADILRQFDLPVVGAVAIPFINVCQDADLIMQKAPAGPGDFVCSSYIGTAHALRRDLFLQLGGYREALFHQGEEGDYCLRMLDAGYVVRLGRSDPIHHFESPRRDFRRMDFYGRRNDILFVWNNVPWPYFPLHLAGATLNGLVAVARTGRPAAMLPGMASGFVECFRHRTERRPVSTRAYTLNRLLKKNGSLPLHQVESQLRRQGQRDKVNGRASPLEANEKDTSP